MLKIDRIITDYEFQACLRKNDALESDRIYCCHGLQHLLDTARIAYIIKLEESLVFTKEIIYAMSLLHDIGRWCEYESGTAHEYASAQIARGVLKRALFCEDDTEQIYEAILHHRKSNAEDSLSYLLYRADKLSRSCYQCTAQSTCHRLSRNDQLHI